MRLGRRFDLVAADLPPVQIYLIISISYNNLFELNYLEIYNLF